MENLTSFESFTHQTGTGMKICISLNSICSLFFSYVPVKLLTSMIQYPGNRHPEFKILR